MQVAACDGSVSHVLRNRAHNKPSNDKTLGYKRFARHYLGIRVKKNAWEVEEKKKKKKAEVLSFSQEPEGEVSVSRGSDKSATCGATPSNPPPPRMGEGAATM